MGLHHSYYAADAEPPPRMRPPYLAIQQRIGSMLRQQYEPPKDLPHQLLALLVELKNQEDDGWGRTASGGAGTMNAPTGQEPRLRACLAATAYGRSWQILLQKSFSTADQKFSGL